MEHRKLLKINSPFYNPGETERGSPNLNFKEHTAVLI